MKNLFEYATKELSQDAFLRWLFESYEDEEIKPVVRALLKEFCNLQADEEIEVITQAQWHYIDVAVFVKSAQKNYALFIEDKAYSSEHQQLIEYDKKIEKYLEKEYTPVKIFYKTSRIDEGEKARIENANSWAQYDIDKIYPLFSPYRNTRNTILKQYIEHIEEIYNIYHCSTFPNSHETKKDLRKWKAFFDNVVVPRFQNEYKCGACVTRFNYTYIQFECKDGEGMPCLEIRSRECTQNQFKVRFLGYGANNDEALEKVKDKMKEQRFFSGREKSKKEIGQRVVSIDGTIDDFIQKVGICLDKYKELVLIWKSESGN